MTTQPPPLPTPPLLPTNSSLLAPSTSLSRRLARYTLRAHLTLYPPRLPPCRPRRALRLFGLLLALGRRFLLLALGDGFFPRCLARFGTLRAAVFDQFEGRADDASLLLYGAAGALFRGFLLVEEWCEVVSEWDVSGED